jgi:hypothetical protein
METLTPRVRCAGRALLLALLLAVPPSRGADDATAATQRIKAVFLYKFAAYVEWPPAAFAQPESPIVIGVAGSDTIARELEQAISGRSVGGRNLQVQRLARGGRLEGCCQILFVGTGIERARATEMLGQAQGQPVLTVTDHDAGYVKGSVINFLEADDRVRFDISREAADRNGLQLRSQLLAVARRVTSP